MKYRKLDSGISRSLIFDTAIWCNNDAIQYLYIFTQPLRSGRIWHKVSF